MAVYVISDIHGEYDLFEELLEEHRQNEQGQNREKLQSSGKEKAPEDLESLKKRWQVRW